MYFLYLCLHVLNRVCYIICSHFPLLFSCVSNIISSWNKGLTFGVVHFLLTCFLDILHCYHFLWLEFLFLSFQFFCGGGKSTFGSYFLSHHHLDNHLRLDFQQTRLTFPKDTYSCKTFYDLAIWDYLGFVVLNGLGAWIDASYCWWVTCRVWLVGKTLRNYNVLASVENFTNLYD